MEKVKSLGCLVEDLCEPHRVKTRLRSIFTLKNWMTKAAFVPAAQLMVAVGQSGGMTVRAAKS